MKTPTYTEKNRKTFFIFALYASLPLFMVATNPADLPLPFILIPFVLIFITLFYVWFKILTTFFYNGDGSRQKAYIVSAVAATLPVLLLVFQSLKQLSLGDVMIVFSIVIGLGLYMRRLEFD